MVCTRFFFQFPVFNTKLNIKFVGNWYRVDECTLGSSSHESKSEYKIVHDMLSSEQWALLNCLLPVNTSKCTLATTFITYE